MITFCGNSYGMMFPLREGNFFLDKRLFPLNFMTQDKIQKNLMVTHYSELLAINQIKRAFNAAIFHGNFAKEAGTKLSGDCMDGNHGYPQPGNDRFLDGLGTPQFHDNAQSGKRPA